MPPPIIANDAPGGLALASRVPVSHVLPNCFIMTFPRLILCLSLPLYLLDQITKFWTVNHLPPPWSPEAHDIPVIDNFFRIVRVHNQGVAFGFGNGSSWAPVVFLVVPIIALTMIRIFWKKGVFDHPLSKVAIALLMTGIFGNLTDRLVQGSLLEGMHGAGLWERLSAGYVVDFLAFKLPFYDKIAPSQGGWWPAFNVADSCICVAAFLIFIGGILEERRAKKAGVHTLLK
jgi:signal peptidase II